MIIIYCTIPVLFVWFLWISRGTNDADPNTLSYRLHRAWRRLAFWAGDVRLDWQWYFGIVPLPLISWVHHEPSVSIEELLEVCKKLKQGDVMLATKFGYVFSNMAIPGCFKHAGIIVKESDTGEIITGLDDKDHPILDLVYDPSSVTLVEAVSEGVLSRHPLYARGDRMIFLRPKHMDDGERSHAADLAKCFVGCEYDVDFKFNITEELNHFENKMVPNEEFQEGTTELQRITKNHTSEYDIAFSCTETVAAAWWFRRKQLGISRKMVRGRLCIISDQFVNRDFTVVWTNVTVDEAEKAGLLEEGVREIENYWKETKHASI